jgi:hypothetical protein
MPPTRRATVVRRTELDLDELMELMTGPTHVSGDPEEKPVSEWDSDAERREAWNRHKDDEPLATARRRERRRGTVLWAEEVYGP